MTEAVGGYQNLVDTVNRLQKLGRRYLETVLLVSMRKDDGYHSLDLPIPADISEQIV